jgi:transposase
MVEGIRCGTLRVCLAWMASRSTGWSWTRSGGRVAHVVTADQTASACPSCGVFSVSLKALVSTRPRDIPYGTTRVRLFWHKRRWRCMEQLCARSSVTESVPAVRAPTRG